MANSRESEFRSALQVSPERIAALDDANLNDLMRELMCAQTYRCGAAYSEIRVNTEGRAKDDGCDGWSPRPTAADVWLGSIETCWQFKAGSAGEPSKLSGEVSKPIPAKTLAAGGRFVVVASGSTNGKKGEDDRIEKLRDEARTAGLPTDKIEVLGSDRLANWCNQHPAIALRWSGRPAGVWRLEQWVQSDQHQVPWQAPPAVEELIEARRKELDIRSGSITHLHIQGPPGVGKTRFALELCRNAEWSGEVVYILQASDVRLLELIDGATSDEGVRLIVVADEVQSEQLRPLRESLGRGEGRVRLITIGHSKTPDPVRIPALAVEPLVRESMTAVVKGWYPAMPIEHVDFVVRFADGYVRLARLAADAVTRNSALNVRGLLDLDHIRAFLDGMLGPGDRRHLYVVAVLENVGWEDDRQLEGMSIAKHFGFDWNEVRATVEDFHRRLGIAPRGGRYRYISPTPLGIHLAVEAWTIYPDLLKTLPAVLPSDEARNAYYERLNAIASNPQAREFAREELSFFFRINDFVDPRAARRWAALSAADPDKAARNLLRALSTVEPEERKRITDRARREIVWTLVRLAWNQSTFHDSVVALALLAEAENESWGNNATGEFLARFQIYLGGTALPYIERLSVLDELITLGRSALTRLVVKALAKVGDQHASRMGTDPTPGDLPQPEWQPKSGRERLECTEEAIRRLCNISKTSASELRNDFVDAARNLVMLLRNSTVRTLVTDFFNALRVAFPETRENLRRVIADILYREKKYWKKLSKEDLKMLEELHAQFEDTSLAARLQQFVGPASWHRDQQIDLTSLAEDLFGDRTNLSGEWRWLTSGQAAEAWRLGQALAVADNKGELEDVLPVLEGRGPDLRLICGYVHARRQTNGTEWYERWVTKQLERIPTDMPLLFEITWRCGATTNITRQLTRAVLEHKLEPHIVGQLAFGAWSDELPTNVIAELVQAMSENGHRETAIAILEHRLSAKPDEINLWDKIALDLVLNTELIRSREMSNYYWKEVATRLVPRHPKAIAASILREHADRTKETWFAEFSDAQEILNQCVEHDASGVWEALTGYLASDNDALSFSIGFPRGLVDHLPNEEIWRWIAENPETRARIVSRFMAKNLSSDSTLASRLLGAYSHIEKVGNTFFSEYISGAWSGSSSDHWNELAARLDEVVGRTALPKLKRWAFDAARSLREMAERDRIREEEEDIRRG